MWRVDLGDQTDDQQWRTQEFFSGGGQQIRLRTERMGMGIWGW